MDHSRGNANFEILERLLLDLATDFGILRRRVVVGERFVFHSLLLGSGLDIGFVVFCFAARYTALEPPPPKVLFLSSFQCLGTIRSETKLPES